MISNTTVIGAIMVQRGEADAMILRHHRRHHEHTASYSGRSATAMVSMRPGR